MMGRFSAKNKNKRKRIFCPKNCNTKETHIPRVLYGSLKYRNIKDNYVFIYRIPEKSFHKDYSHFAGKTTLFLYQCSGDVNCALNVEGKNSNNFCRSSFSPTVGDGCK
jgi:hypothetical protein